MLLLSLQEIRVLRSVSFDRNIVQFCGACLQPRDTMMILEFMAVRILTTICVVSDLVCQHQLLGLGHDIDTTFHAYGFIIVIP